MTLIITTMGASAVVPPAPNNVRQSPRGDSAIIKRNTPDDINESVSRGAVRQNTSTNSRVAPLAPTNGVVSNRGAVRAPVASRPDSVSARTTTSNSARTATSARVATPVATISRSGGISRATAIFDDVSKIGTGYATCRDAYSTCMDQFCAKSNETYRRCYCSEKFMDFRDAEYAIAESKTLLMKFEDNNLNAIDKTKSEVDAMYSASVGEAAIKNDTSGAQQTLSEISDLLSGKKKSNIKTQTSISLDFSGELEDIWGANGGGDSIFSSALSNDLTSKEGVALYNAAQTQCIEMIKSSCENNSVFNMAKSSYSILIGQDCNAYEKKINAQKETVIKTVREAEKILRSARLDEYRAHNSADVNECVTAVKKVMLGDNACGENYKKCLDYTGSYINVNTGEPIYSPQLFKLSGILNLNGTGNVIQSNPNFNKFLNDKRKFAETALDTCRGKAEVVWEEFKRNAIIEIAQAQDAKIEEVKSSCVDTITECYDTQSGALKSFDNSTAQASGALNAYAARAMCSDKVDACAALYDGGLPALLGFVNLVDTVKISEGCTTALVNYAKEICTPKTGTQPYPYDCRLRTTKELTEMFNKRADLYCTDPTTKQIAENVSGTIESLIDDINGEIEDSLATVCIEKGGVWDRVGASTEPLEQTFIKDVFGGTNISDSERGKCVQNTEKNNCEQLDNLTGSKGWATYTNGKCTFTNDWYKYRCEVSLNGLWENSACYVD